MMQAVYNWVCLVVCAIYPSRSYRNLIFARLVVLCAIHASFYYESYTGVSSVILCFSFMLNTVQTIRDIVCKKENGVPRLDRLFAGFVVGFI